MRKSRFNEENMVAVLREADKATWKMPQKKTRQAGLKKVAKLSHH